MLPNFLVIGAPKAGTTSLHHYLASHPDISMCTQKDTHFFTYVDREPPTGPGDERFGRIRDVKSYESLFEPHDGSAIVGEVSVSYLAVDRSQDAIARLLPDVRLIAILRDPVDRALSQYLHLRREGLEPYRDLASALAAEARRRAAGWHVSWWYREAGRYAQQLQRCFERFGRDRVLVLTFDDLVRDPLAQIQRVYRFLGADDTWTPPLAVHNPGGASRSASLEAIVHRPPVWISRAARAVLTGDARARLAAAAMRFNRRAALMPPKLQRELSVGFAEDVDRLRSLLDLELATWPTST